MRVFVVISAYNEEKHIASVVSEVRKYIPDVIVVDDCSRDATSELARQSGAIVVRHRINLGKAGSMKTGCEAAVYLGAQAIVLMDGDGQHNPNHLPAFLDALAVPATEFVFGSRMDSAAMPFVRRLGTKLLEHGMRTLFGVNIYDMQCGYRAFKTSVYPRLRWQSKRYHADAEITARVGKYHLVYTEIPIETIYHDEFKGMTVFDGIAILGKLILWKFTL